MKNTSYEPREMGGDPNETNSQCPRSSCIDIIATINIENNYQKKIRLIDHIYECQACRNAFGEYLSILERITIFSNSSGRIMRAKQHFHENVFYLSYLSLHFRSLILIFFSVIIAAFLVFRFLPSESANSVRIPVQMRGVSSSINDVFPKPFSSVSRVSLHFQWEPLGKSLPQGICVYNSDLELIWESDYSMEKKVLLPGHIIGILSKDRQYYWSIKTRAESGTSVYSILLPFSIID
jgi:hypothetical protein